MIQAPFAIRYVATRYSPPRADAYMILDPLRPHAAGAVGRGDDPVLPVPADAGRSDRRLYRHDLQPRSSSAQLKQTFGLDRPLLEQYLIYLGNLLTGEFGISFHQRRPVLERPARACCRTRSC